MLPASAWIWSSSGLFQCFQHWPDSNPVLASASFRPSSGILQCCQHQSDYGPIPAYSVAASINLIPAQCWYVDQDTSTTLMGLCCRDITPLLINLTCHARLISIWYQFSGLMPSWPSNTYIYKSAHGLPWLSWWVVAYLVPSHYLNQWELIIN